MQFFFCLPSSNDGGWMKRFWGRGIGGGECSRCLCWGRHSRGPQDTGAQQATSGDLGFLLLPHSVSLQVSFLGRDPLVPGDAITMTKELSGKRETGACENCGNGSHWKIGEKSPNLKFAGAIEGKLYTIGKVRFSTPINSLPDITTVTFPSNGWPRPKLCPAAPLVTYKCWRLVHLSHRTERKKWKILLKRRRVIPNPITWCQIWEGQKPFSGICKWTHKYCKKMAQNWWVRNHPFRMFLA